MKMMFKRDLGDGAELFIRGPEHAEECFALIDANREHLAQWLNWVDGCKTVEDIRASIDRAAQAFNEKGEVVAAICVGGRIAGIAGLEHVNEAGNAQIGYWLGKHYEGRGLVTRACRALLDYAFGTLGLERVAISVAVDNHRSKAVPKRLGFTYEGTLRHAHRLRDRFQDLEIYSMLRDDWPRSPGA